MLRNSNLRTLCALLALVCVSKNVSAEVYTEASVLRDARTLKEVHGHVAYRLALHYVKDISTLDAMETAVKILTKGYGFGGIRARRAGEDFDVDKNLAISTLWGINCCDRSKLYEKIIGEKGKTSLEDCHLKALKGINKGTPEISIIKVYYEKFDKSPTPNLESMSRAFKARAIGGLHSDGSLGRVSAIEILPYDPWDKIVAGAVAAPVALDDVTGIPGPNAEISRIGRSFATAGRGDTAAGAADYPVFDADGHISLRSYQTQFGFDRIVKDPGGAPGVREERNSR